MKADTKRVETGSMEDVSFDDPLMDRLILFDWSKPCKKIKGEGFSMADVCGNGWINGKYSYLYISKYAKPPFEKEEEFIFFENDEPPDPPRPAACMGVPVPPIRIGRKANFQSKNKCKIIQFER